MSQTKAYEAFSFDDGYYPPEREKEMQEVLALKKNVITSVADDQSIQTTIASDLLKECSDIDTENPALPKLIVPPKKFDENFSVQLVGKGNEASLEFVPTKGTAYPTPKPLEHSCNDAVIYYLRPDRIVVNQGYDFESGPNIFLWDGKEWKSLFKVLKDQVKVRTNLGLGEVNATNFIIKETGGCCEETFPIVFRSWSKFVIDVNTLKIVDVISK